MTVARERVERIGIRQRLHIAAVELRAPVQLAHLPEGRLFPGLHQPRGAVAAEAFHQPQAETQGRLPARARLQ